VERFAADHTKSVVEEGLVMILLLLIIRIIFYVAIFTVAIAVISLLLARTKRELTTGENKRENRQKPPLSVGRIAGEICAGVVAGLAVALPISYVFGELFFGTNFGRISNLGSRAMLVLTFFPLHGLTSAVGVYLVGSIGQQTGSFLWTIVTGFLGGLVMLGALVMLVMLPSLDEYFGLVMAEEEIVRVVLLLVLPGMTMLAFNLTRGYKTLSSS